MTTSFADIVELVIAIVLISFYLYYWFKVSAQFYTNRSNTEKNEDVQVTFICAFRNEQEHLLNFLECIKSTSDKRNWKWILINDHSSDNSVYIIKQFQAENPKIDLSIIHLPNNLFGKKSAIDTGVLSANTEWIYCIDADITFKETNIHQLISETIKSSAKLAFGGIRYTGGNSFKESYQIIENTALIALGRYHFFNNRPSMGNAANMLFQKNYYLELNPFQENLNVMGGDDIFFIEKSWNFDKKLHFSNNPNTAFETKVLTKWSELIRQRIRWAQKTKYQSTQKTHISQILLVLFFMVYWGILIHFLVKGIYAYSLLLFLFKTIGDQLFLKRILSRSSQKLPLLRIIQSSIFQAFFIIFIGISQNFIKGNWKGRTATLH